MYKLGILLIVSFIILGCSSKNLMEDSQALKNQQELSIDTDGSEPNDFYQDTYFEYTIAPHDRVSITVYNHPELSTTSDKGMLVDGNGDVNLPLINRVHIAHLTQTQASNKLQRLYSKYLKHANVHLEVLNKRAFIIGEVKNPGVIPLENESAPLLQALAQAGGFTDYANKSEVVLIRKNGYGSHIQILNLTGANSLSAATTIVQPNDIIYVVPNSMKNIATNIMPVFKMISTTLSPFVSYKAITN